MVCKAGQTCQIKFATNRNDENKALPSDKFLLHESTRGQELYDYVASNYNIPTDDFALYIVSGGYMFELSEAKDKTMSEVGVNFSFDQDQSEAKHTLLVANSVDPSIEKPTKRREIITFRRKVPEYSLWDEIDFENFSKTTETTYVGLVNQAMTCYLNSLLQALYMTPEFRNALYNWEYVEGSEKDEADSIPYQLQKLFLNLQTSSKSAVETTALTKSFGWDSTEAWQQHDIEELCRVMFDALERKFRYTEQADLIKRLYEGKMTDYVKCLECGTEKSREDSFLDVPLPVRSYDSNVPYNSVEDAIRAFVQYETLEGNNQYHCDKCNKKCDAHKGLKFTKFPYLLTLHLKRFDYDFKTCHRIKLNDKVTFPDILNLNSFISSTTSEESPGGEEDIGLSVKCDDSLTTDSGTLDDDCPPCENSLTNSNHSTNQDQDDDEGIDISNGASTSNSSTSNQENEKNRDNCSTAEGPYNYELFSIMIHSGSASGGHYYAFIKDFRSQEWFSFNDQSVTQITHEDIKKSYGGGSTRGYYSGAYSSSTNAYMLMYRQIDPIRNALPMKQQDFPKHIQELLKKMEESEDNEKQDPREELEIITLRVHCRHPVEGMMMQTSLYALPEMTLDDATEDAYKAFALMKIVSLDQCRLVSYAQTNDLIECSYEGRGEEKMTSISQNKSRLNLLLEIRRPDEKFQTYLPGGITTKVYVIDVPNEDVIDGPLNVRGLNTQTVREYKEMLGKIINMDPKQMKIALRMYGFETKLVEKEDSELQNEGFNIAKVFVSTMLDTDSSKPFYKSKIHEIIERFDGVISLHVYLPDTSKDILEELSISLLEDRCKNKKNVETNDSSTVNESNREPATKFDDIPKEGKNNNDIPAVTNVSPQLAEATDEWNAPEQSNSEDSSLSDSDKTLVGDVPKDEIVFDFKCGDMRRNMPWHKQEGGTKQWFNTMVQRQEEEEEQRVGETVNNVETEHYFVAKPDTNSANKKLLKVLVNNKIRLDTLKKYLEPYVGVPVEYFKVFHHSKNEEYESGETECRSLTEKLIAYEDGERLDIRLGRVLGTGEFKVKLYQLLHIDSAEPYKFLCDWIGSKDMTVGQAKKEILADVKRKYNIDIPYERCRLRKKVHLGASKVYLDEEKFEDLALSVPFPFIKSEMILQELPDKEPVTDSKQTVIYVKRWHPAKLELDQFQEIVIDEKTNEELKQKLSAISGIPEEYIDMAKGWTSFPCDFPVRQMQNYLNYNPYHGDELCDGTIIYYRDNREKVKYMTEEEFEEALMAYKPDKHAIRDRQSSTKPRRSRRGRPLKISVDAK